VGGTLKADADIVIDEGALIEGNVISRRSVTIGPRSRVEGNVFAERDVRVGSEASIGREGPYKTVYAARHVTLGASVSVYGWIVAERGGKVEELHW